MQMKGNRIDCMMLIEWMIPIKCVLHYKYTFLLRTLWSFKSFRWVCAYVCAPCDFTVDGKTQSNGFEYIWKYLRMLKSVRSRQWKQKITFTHTLTVMRAFKTNRIMHQVERERRRWKESQVGIFDWNKIMNDGWLDDRCMFVFVCVKRAICSDTTSNRVCCVYVGSTIHSTGKHFKHLKSRKKQNEAPS